VEPSPLTDESFWDDYWESVRLPVEVTKSSSVLIGLITDVFDRFLGSPRRLSILEIGGAPGQYAAYVHRRFGHSITILDSSPIGCEKTRENLDLLGLPGQVFEGDMFDPPPGLTQFDAVYSLGLIEHFDDVTKAVAAHLKFVAPGGLLLLGVPNLRGINGALMRRLAPSFLARHQLQAMDESTWDRFEPELQMERVFRAYLGGFEPGVFWRCESRRLGYRFLHQALWYLGKALGQKQTAFLRRANGRLWSAYLMGVYRSAHDGPVSSR
jgi:SAM-dependent methyltransferase